MQFTKEFIHQFYQLEGIREKHHQHNIYSNEHSCRRYEKVVNGLKKYVSGKVCLEIGCAEGLYCREMLKAGAEFVIGYELSAPKLDRAERDKKIVYVKGNWDDLPFIENSFDFTLLTECLEHSFEPQTLIDNIMKITKQVMVTVPIKEELYDNPFIPRPEGLPPSGHLQAFRKETFLPLFQKYNVECYEENTLYAYLVASK